MGWAPDFPEFRQVELDDEEFLGRMLKQEQPEASELNFPNIYLWRNSYDFRLAAIGGGVAIHARDNPADRSSCRQSAYRSLSVQPAATAM